MRDSVLEIILGIVGRRKWLGLFALVTTLSVGIPFAMFLPNVYRGVATVSIENLEASDIVRNNVPELETRLITIQQDLLSRGRLSDLVVRLNLYPRLRPSVPMESILASMRRDIHIELFRGDTGRPTTSGIKISYIGLDAKSAAAVPNTLAALYVAENTRIRERQTTEMAEFLRRQVESARSALDIQQRRLDRFKEVQAGQLPEQVSLNMVTLERLNTRLRLNTNDQLQIRELQDRLGAGLTTADGAIDPLLAAKRRLADLQAKYTDQHPDVIRTKGEIAQLERQRAAAPAAPVDRAAAGSRSEAALVSLQSEEKMLRSEIAQYEARIQAAPKVEQDLEALQRDYNAARETYGSILKRYEEAQLAESLEQTKMTESFRILDPAVVPSFPAAPNRMRLLLLAIFFAVGASIGTMLLSEHLDTSFHSVGELRQFTTVPVLASIPFVPTRTSIGRFVRVAFAIVGVAMMCVLLAGFAYKTARHNTQLVWMLSAPQV